MFFLSTFVNKRDLLILFLLFFLLLHFKNSGISSTQSISKSGLDEPTSEPNSILDELDVQKYLIYKKEPVLSIKETPKKGNKKGQVLTDELKEELQGAPVDALIVLATVSNIRKKGKMTLLNLSRFQLILKIF